MFVYVTTNLVNGRKYVGRSTRPINSSYLGSGKLLKKAIKKYGKENFRRDIIEVLPNSAKLIDLIECEAKWIKFYNAPNNPLFYNLSWRCGGFGKGSTHRPESRKRLSKTMKENVYKNGLPKEWKENVIKSLHGRTPWNKGKTLTEEERNARKPNKKPRVFSPEDIDEIRSLYEQEISATKISEKFECSHHTILNIVRKQGRYAEE